MVGILFSATIFAADMKVGVINDQKVLENSTELKAAAAAFQKKMAPDKAKIEAKQAELKKMMDQIEKEGAVMAPADKLALQNKIMTERQNLSDMMQGAQQKAMDAQQGVMRDIQKKVDVILPVIAKNNNLNLIIAREAVIYADPTMDYTDQVIKALNK